MFYATQAFIVPAFCTQLEAKVAVKLVVQLLLFNCVGVRNREHKVAAA